MCSCAGQCMWRAVLTGVLTLQDNGETGRKPQYVLLPTARYNEAVPSWNPSKNIFRTVNNLQSTLFSFYFFIFLFFLSENLCSPVHLLPLRGTNVEDQFPHRPASINGLSFTSYGQWRAAHAEHGRMKARSCKSSESPADFSWKLKEQQFKCDPAQMNLAATFN